MRSSLLVAQWEFRKTLRNRAVLLSTFLFPLMLITLSVVMPVVVENLSRQGTVTIGVVDEAGSVWSELEKRLDGARFTLQRVDDPDAAERALLAKELGGVLLVSQAGLAQGVVPYWVRGVTETLPAGLGTIVDEAIRTVRLREAGLPVEEVMPLVTGVSLMAQPRVQGERSVADFAVSFGLAFLLVLATLITAGVVMNSVIAEKTSRTVEILLSSITPRDLLLGKVLGYGAIGILQVAVWAAVALVAASRFLPGIWTALSPQSVVIAVGYFVLGYLFSASMYALLGAMMRDLQSSSQSVSWVAIIPAVPLFVISFIIQFPDAGWVRAMGFIPPFTATTMLFRTAVTSVPLWEILATMAVLALTDYLLVRLAAKVFEVGMLMYGKSASPREVWRWIRRSQVAAR
ncbi:MAG: ABC transporter permease [Candidatus Bipolaricaulota bacterium]